MSPGRVRSESRRQRGPLGESSARRPWTLLRLRGTKREIDGVYQREYAEGQDPHESKWRKQELFVDSPSRDAAEEITQPFTIQLRPDETRKPVEDVGAPHELNFHASFPLGSDVVVPFDRVKAPNQAPTLQRGTQYIPRKSSSVLQVVKAASYRSKDSDVMKQARTQSDLMVER